MVISLSKASKSHSYGWKSEPLISYPVNDAVCANMQKHDYILAYNALPLRKSLIIQMADKVMW